jgi:hypothetical protein
MSAHLAVIILAAVASATGPASASYDVQLAAAVRSDVPPKDEKDLTPEERMARRFPQPVRVGDLIGLPVLDDDDFTLGYVRQVVRTPEGKIRLIVSYGGWFGWGARPVAVPIEVVAILGRQLAALDMPPKEFAAAPTWTGGGETVLQKDEMIRIALGRR